MAGKYKNENFSASYSDMGYPTDVSDAMGFSPDVIDENRTKILLTGLRRSGKSSIHRVVFEKMSPNETLFLEPTNEIRRQNINNGSFVQFQIWDFPGDIEFDDRVSGPFDSEKIFKAAGALIYVIDAQDDLSPENISKLISTVTRAYEVNPSMKFEVFIHKVDCLTDEQKLEAHRNIQEQAEEELQQSKLDIRFNFYLTSIFDHSIFEAFSKVVQRLIPQLPTLERLLDLLQSNCRMEKTFLIDVISKIYIATDSYPVDMQIYELCSDMIDVVIDVSCIYGVKQEGETDPETRAVIKLNSGMVLYLREVNKYLALVCMIRGDKFDKQGLIDYNFECLKKAITGVFDVSRMHNDRNRYQ
uniref:Ras-related GTP-binding protein n=1 Tax=Arcella intermedia TaxID=1963864 RepID=A0A6B2L859_9EUKA|eukprot:TRINITY_DN23553_c0_g1_i1.p1 TRINITY_DN23553_c0_g1~~TRINITY_DN23553_c0_g1_i1.p1  ORF type:complete len:358 (+),score=88.72 TRINITY_DN23553_c0_g1_i1:81-1154(+)